MGVTPYKNVDERMNVTMKREWLKELGIDENLVDKIMSQNGEDIENAKSTVKESYKEMETENATLNKTIKERDKQLEDIKKQSGDNAELTKQIAEMQKANAEAIKAKDAEIAKIKLDNAVEKALVESNARDIKSVMVHLNLEGAELAEDGTVKGLSEQIAKLKADENKSFLFEADSSKATVKGATPPQQTITTPQGSEWEQKLAECRKNGDNVGAIAVKRQAMEQGINLF